jgi:hypothetical protein
VRQPGLEAGRAEGALDGAVVLAGAFAGDHPVVEVLGAPGLADAFAGGLEVAAVGGHGGGFEQGPALAVGEGVAGPGLGRVDGDDAERLGADQLGAGRPLAMGLLQDEALAGLAAARGLRTWPGNLLSGTGRVHPQPKRQSGGKKRESFVS